MKRLKDFKVTERISRPAVNFLTIQFGDDEATHRNVVHHARCVILQHKEEIQKLAYKSESGFFTLFLACQNFKISHDQSAFIKIHPIALSKSHFLIWTNWKNLSI